MKASSRFGIFLMILLLLISSIAAACSSEDEKTTEQKPAETTTPATSPAPSAKTAVWTGDPVVQTIYGKVRGVEDESGTWVWKAIPYARPPLGDLRWKAPQDPESWESVREEAEFCNACPQYDPVTGTSVVGDEDCLYLNIWRPQSEETSLPVYVWIHGGGNSIGSATQVPTYYGTSLAHKSNMVFVSLNYRLGPIGWFTHPSLDSGDQMDDSGNYGTLDIIKALEWIQGNIEAFGGDPNRVTVTGESAGAVNVFSLMMSPVAEGLFHRAMAQSGMAVSVPVAEGEKSANDVICTMLINDGLATDEEEAQAYLAEMPDAEIAEYLRSKTPDEILACYEQKGFGLLLFPHIFQDGTVIPIEGTDTFETCPYPSKVPLILGSNKEELKMFLFMNPAFEGRDELYQIVTSYGSDLWKVAAVDDVARKISACPDQPPVYAYQFNWGAGWESGESPIPEPYDLKVGAAHSLDVPFFLGNPCFNVIMTDWVFTEENRPGREALSSAMMTYVAEFARTGHPDKPASGLPEWKPWSSESGEPKCILFDADLNNVKIEMSDLELTDAGVIDRMKSEVSEPLLSEALEFISSEWTISHLLEEDEIDYRPPPAEESSPEPTASPEQPATPEPTGQSDSFHQITLTYEVHYEYEDIIDDTTWTVTRVSEEVINGTECYVTEISFDTNPERSRYVPAFGQDFPITLTDMLTWIDKVTIQPLTAESSTSSAGFPVNTTVVYTYNGRYGAPFSVGNEWSYEMVSTPSMGPEMTGLWDAEVVGMEDVTVPAGKFNCYKVIHTDDSGDTITEWWAAGEGDTFAVKMVDEANWNGTETRELVSYSYQ